MQTTHIVVINYRVVHEAQRLQTRKACLGKRKKTRNVVKTEMQFNEGWSIEVSNGLNRSNIVVI